jgi:hypothetical protein
MGYPEIDIRQVSGHAHRYFRATDSGDVWDALASYDPKLPQRGGKRNPDTCAVHPSADIIQRTVKLCSVDSKPIAPATQKRLRRQNEDVGEGPSQTVSGSNLGGHFDDVGGYDGEEQSRAAAMVETKLIRPDVDAWKQPIFPDLDSARPTHDGDAENPPCWLEEWPDEGDSPPIVTCTRCSEPVAPGHKLYCAVHLTDAEKTVMQWERPSAVAGGEE